MGDMNFWGDLHKEKLISSQDKTKEIEKLINQRTFFFILGRKETFYEKGSNSKTTWHNEEMRF